MPSDHFLDSNVLVGSRISWDKQYSDAVQYMAVDGIIRHTSKRVYYESKGVFERSRGLILKFLKEFYERFSKYSNALHIEQTVRKFTESFIKPLKEKEEKIINSFVNQNFEDLKNVALNGESELGDFRQNVIDSIKSAINSIDNDCHPDSSALVYRYDSCPDYYKINIGYTELYNVIGYENDALVLMDSNLIKNNYIKNDVCFITADQKHILSNKKEIERILSGIFVMSPKSFK